MANQPNFRKSKSQKSTRVIVNGVIAWMWTVPTPIAWMIAVTVQDQDVTAMSIHKTMWLTIIEQCNNRCIWCYEGSSPEKVKQMSYERAVRVIDKLKILGIKECVITGGEPTLHPDLFKIIEYLKQNRIKTTLLTNGRRLKDMDYTKSLLTTGVDRIAVSIEGLKETHEKITGAKGSFDETLAGIKNLIKLNANFNTITTIGKTNLREIEDLYSFLNNLGVKSIVFNVAGPSFLRKHNETPNLTELAELLKRMFKKKMRFRFITSLPLCLFIDTPEMITSNTVHGRCQVYTGLGAAITVDEDVLPCTHFTKKIGDIHDTYEDKYEQFKKEITKYPSRKCDGCILWGACAGGCPILWTELNAEEEIPGLKGKTYEGRPASPGIAIGYIGKDIKVFDVATVEKELELINVKGVITEQRSVITHFAIIARELGIPCVAGVKIEEEGVCIVNGYMGKVFVLR